MLQGVCSPKQTDIPQGTCGEIQKAKKTNLSLVKLCVCYGSLLCFTCVIKG